MCPAPLHSGLGFQDDLTYYVDHKDNFGMTINQLPIGAWTGKKHDVRSQFAALCFRMVAGKPQILLITSRRTKRWIVPKGWPVAGMTPADTAAQEAWEEAGVRGEVYDQCLGVFSYAKVMDENRAPLPCLTMVYPLAVSATAAQYPEVDQRRRKWFTPKKAATKVLEPELAHILSGFDPRVIR